MACSTLALVAVAIFRHRRDIYSDHTVFDPSNPLHLIAAASAGGLSNVFKGFGEQDIDDGAKLLVSLKSVPGYGPALVRADEYTPVFAGNFASE